MLRRMENDSPSKFLLEATLERCRPMKWLVPQTFVDVKAVLSFVFFIVEVTLVSVQDVQGPRSFRLVSVGIVSMGGGNGASGGGVNLEAQTRRQPGWR